jgi:hypothetical protein
MPRNRIVEKWHVRARRARERAVGMRDDALKHMLLAIADAYDNLAKRAEDSAQLSDRPSCDSRTDALGRRSVEFVPLATTARGSGEQVIRFMWQAQSSL